MVDLDAALREQFLDVAILGATTHPATSWVTHLARNLIMDLDDAGCPVKYLIRDRDRKYPPLFDAILADAGLTVVLRGIRMPRLNPIMERWSEPAATNRSPAPAKIMNLHIRRHDRLRELFHEYEHAAELVTPGPRKCRETDRSVLVNSAGSVSIEEMAPSDWRRRVGWGVEGLELFRSLLGVSSVRRLWFDPVLVGSVLWTALGCALFFVAADDSATQVQVFWVFQPPLDVVLAWCCWRVYRIGTGVIRRFWLVLTVVGTLFLVGDIQQAIVTVLHPVGKSTTGETVQTVCQVLGLAAIVVNMLIHPQAGRSGRDRLAFWLDAATVLVAGGVLAWCFLIAPTGQRGSDLVGTMMVAGVALTAAFASVKMVLTGNAPMHKLAAAAMIGSAIAMGAGAFLAPADAGGALPPLVSRSGCCRRC